MADPRGFEESDSEAEKRRLEELPSHDDDGDGRRRRFMEAPSLPLQSLVTKQKPVSYRRERRRHRKAAPRSPPQRLVTEQGFEESDSGTESSTGEAEMFAEGFEEFAEGASRFAEGRRRHRRGVSSHEFKLIGSSNTEYPPSAVTLSCNLSPELSAVDLEIRWFKETECVYLYKNRQVTEGKGYEDRVSLFRDELEKGNVSLQLKNCSRLDLGYYLCQVTDGVTTEELTVRITRALWVHQSSPLQRVFTKQTDRKWTNEEKLKMEKSSLLIEYNSLLSEFKKKCSNLEKTQEELKNTKLELEQVMETNQTKLERLEKELQDKNSQIQEKDKQLQEKDDLKEEQLQEHTDPDPSVPIRRRNSIELPPLMSGESSGDLEMEKLQ